MAVKKTQLYASLWASCDKLRGGMDSSEYKDYILTLLFMKYVTDKFKNKGAYEDIKVFDKAHDKDPDPEKRTGCSFDDFIALKGKKNIGEGMDKIIARLADENTDLKGVIDIAHFNDEKKLGSGKEMVDKLTDLISIFQRPELDFSRNKAEGDDIIGDAYEFLMRKFATESGKSKGQFYTPAEVSRILANVVGISHCTDASATVCDPACGSGSLLIRAIDAAPFPIMGYGQEKESTTAGLAKMNAVLHRKAEIIIKSGNTFSNPQYMDKSDNSVLERFDYIVANPPFSMKNWRDGIAGKEYGRFEGYGDMPPEKNGDYAWLMHILKTLKSNGKAAVILPHGVLFRGNAEATIRETIIKKHWIKGIISLPANLFYGTGIAACVLVIDKEGAANRQGIFMIDASRGYVKDGNKNRLRERDIYRIITTFNEQITTDPKYARFIPNDEIEKKNGYNLNITRYIDSTDPEDIQDIYAHIHGGIPAVDIDGLSKYWEVFPSLKSELLSTISEKYYSLNVEHESIRQTIYKNTEFSEYGEKLDEAFAAWKAKEYPVLSTLDEDVSARELIVSLAEDIIAEFEHLTLIDKYDAYQVLLAYWNEVMNDDVSLIISESDGYTNARATDNIEEEITQGKNKGEMKVTGWEGRLLPKSIVINAFFRKERNAIEEAESIVAETESQLSDLIESADEESALADELTHLLTRKHDATFIAHMDRYMPNWREVRKELNDSRLDYYEAQDESPLQKLIDQSRYDDIRDAAIAYIQEEHSGDAKRLSVIDMEIENVIHIEQLEDGVIAFDVIASCDVEMPSASRKGYFNERWLKIHCQVTLGIDMSGFRIMSVGNCEPQEESDNDRLSGELVPIISREQFEDEAEKFLTRYCPEALEKPMRVPIETIASDMKLQVIEDVPLSDDLTYFGTIIFDNGNVLDKHRKITIRNAKRGTVYLDPRVSYERSVGTKRTTLTGLVYRLNLRKNKR